MRKLILCILILIIFSGPTSATWANMSFNKSAAMHIYNGNNSVLTYFSAEANITYDPSMNANFSDLRIYNNTGAAIPLHFKKKVDGSYLLLRYNLTSIPALSWDNTTHRLYWNNSTITNNASNGNATYQFYEDFEDQTYAGWNVQSGTWSATNRYLDETSHAAAWTGISIPYSQDELTFESDVLWQGDTANLYFFDKLGNTVSSTGYSLSLITGTTGNIYEFPAASVVKSFTKDNNNEWHQYQIKRNASGGVRVYYDYNDLGNGSDASPLTGSQYLSAWSYAFGGVSPLFDNITIRKYATVEPTTILGEPEYIYENNYTNDQNLNFSVLQNTAINFWYNATIIDWYVDGVAQSTTANSFNYTISGSNTSTLIKAQNSTSNITWNVTSIVYPLELLIPSNGTTQTSPTTLTWREWVLNSPYTYQVSTDYQFINIITSGIGTTGATENITATVALDPGVYYWRVKNSTGTYISKWFNFSISPAPATPGQLNISVRDEVTNVSLSTFSAQIYNTTTTLNKSTTTGWVNYSSSEVISGQYLIRIIPNSSYASRSVLANSPANVTVWLPATSNTIDTIAFYLLDYTNKYPWETSYLSVTKNNSVMHSAYFDADAKVAVYLIRGESYGISVANGNNMQNWGNYISTASGNVEVVIMNLGVNSTLRNPFVYNVTWNSSDIVLQWADSYNVMTSINYSIFKGTGKTLVHQLITSVDHGSSDYIVTNTSDVYYVNVSALTTNGYRNQSYVIDYRAGSSATDGESSDLYTWSYGSVTIPDWVKNAFAVLALMILAGSFGAMHRGEGAIITGIMSLVFWKWSWLSATGAGAGFLGALLLFAVLYHLDTKRKGGGYF